MTSIGERAFEGCEALTSIEVAEDNKNYDSIDGVLYDKEKKTLIQCPGGKTNIEIPNSVTSIGSSAFEGCEALTSINIPNSVTEIGDDAFWGCKALTSVTIPNSVTSIGRSAFRGCIALTSIEIPNSVTSIGKSAFEGCKALTSIEIPNSVTSIGEWAFDGCEALTSIEIPNSVTSIGDQAFAWCKALTSIHIRCEHPENLKIYEEAFYKTNIENCTLHVPKWTENVYRQHPAFRKFKKIKVKHDNFIEFIMYLIIGKYI